MKNILVIAAMALALSLCNLTEKLTGNKEGGNSSNANQSREEVVKSRITELFDLCKAGKSSDAASYLKEPKEAEDVCRRITASLDRSDGYEFGKSMTQRDIIAWEVYFKRGAERRGEMYAFAPVDDRYVLVDIDPISSQSGTNGSSSATAPPAPSQSDANATGSGAMVSGGVLNSKATSLPKPPYPPIAKAAKASGTVVVQVVVDETGKVITARAVSGHPLLRASAEQAARQATFAPTVVSGKPVKVSGTITYDFQP